MAPEEAGALAADEALGIRTWQNRADECRQRDENAEREREAKHGWEFARDVACSVERMSHGGDRRSSNARNSNGKTSATEFADRWATSTPRVIRYLEGWREAAKQGIVPNPDTLTPQDDPTIPTDPAHSWIVPASEDPRRHGRLRFYDNSGKTTAPSGGRPRASQDEIADRAAADPVYAKELTEKIAAVQPRVVASVAAAAKPKGDDTPKPARRDERDSWEVLSDAEKQRLVRLKKEMDARQIANDLLHEPYVVLEQVLMAEMAGSWLVKHEKWPQIRALAEWYAAHAEAAEAADLTPEMFA